MPSKRTLLSAWLVAQILLLMAVKNGLAEDQNPTFTRTNAPLGLTVAQALALYPSCSESSQDSISFDTLEAYSPPLAHLFTPYRDHYPGLSGGIGSEIGGSSLMIPDDHKVVLKCGDATYSAAILPKAEKIFVFEKGGAKDVMTASASTLVVFNQMRAALGHQCGGSMGSVQHANLPAALYAGSGPTDVYVTYCDQGNVTTVLEASGVSMPLTLSYSISYVDRDLWRQFIASKRIEIDDQIKSQKQQDQKFENQF